MSLPQRKLLVTTALEESWGSDESLLFLGEWCKRYDRRHVWTARRHETVRFHWDDRKKLRRDYDYLKSLHETLLNSLASSLNSLHGVERSVRYWQLLIDPWLMSFVSVVYDRWECLRVAFQKHGELTTIVSDEGDAKFVPPFSYGEYAVNMPYTDEWNYRLYRRIIEAQYAGTCEVQRKSGSWKKAGSLGESAQVGSPWRGARWVATSAWAASFASAARRGLRRRIASKIDQLVGLCGVGTDIVFVESYFGVGSLIRLNFALGQLPRWFLREFDGGEASVGAPSSDRGSPNRTELRLKFQPSSAFETFLVSAIVNDAPVSFVEAYTTLRDWARSRSIRTKVIVTANAHWSHAHVKAWMAEQVESGAKLVILEHGGSVPDYREIFEWEEDVSDVKGTWFLPYHVKHVQLPPSKLVKAFGKGFGSRVRGHSKAPHCVLIGNEEPRYVHRTHFRPMAAQCLTSFDLVGRFHQALDQEVSRAFRVRPQVDFGWNTRQRYLDMLGSKHVLQTVGPLSRSLSSSRVIVCTYPETTFSEAMVTGVPTILIYPDHLYERHPIAVPLLDLLRSVKVVFHDPTSAAEHVNLIWRDPDRWWDSDQVRYAKDEFRRQALRFDGDWLTQWTSFIQGLVT